MACSKGIAFHKDKIPRQCLLSSLKHTVLRHTCFRPDTKGYNIENLPNALLFVGCCCFVCFLFVFVFVCFCFLFVVLCVVVVVVVLFC